MFHVKHQVDDLIAAIATPRGQGGMGIIRISGKGAVALLLKVFSPKKKILKIKPRRVYYGWIKKEGQVIDEATAITYPQPKSYTGEEMVEIIGHGGNVVLRSIMKELLRRGAREAEPGEFTKRAFINGKISLIKAESIIDLISAKTEKAASYASSQMTGKLGERVKEMRGKLVDLLASEESKIDYPEEEDSHEIGQEIERAIKGINKLIESGPIGKIIREGARVAIIGKPNVGKSSLLNALLEEERAIISKEPGTTRDTIEEGFEVDGFPLVLVDTAGLRVAKGEPEEKGIERAKKAKNEAEVILVVVDGSKKIEKEDRVVIKETEGQKRIIVANKADLGENKSWERELKKLLITKTSAKTGVGIKKLINKISGVLGLDKKEEIANGLQVNERHLGSLERAKEALIRANGEVCGANQREIVAIEIKEAIEAIGEIDGETVSEEVIKQIFKKFCVGK